MYLIIYLQKMCMCVCAFLWNNMKHNHITFSSKQNMSEIYSTYVQESCFIEWKIGSVYCMFLFFSASWPASQDHHNLKGLCRREPEED